jgi:hypothetical protein
MAKQSLDKLMISYQGTLELEGEHVSIKDEKRFIKSLDNLIREAVFGDAGMQAAARWLIWDTAQALGIGIRTLSNKLRSYGYAPREKSFVRAA